MTFYGGQSGPDIPQVAKQLGFYDQCFRLGIVDDIRHFLRFQGGIDGHHHGANTTKAQKTIDVFQTVLHQQGDFIPGFYAKGFQVAGHTANPPMHLAIGNLFAAVKKHNPVVFTPGLLFE
ncbi:MAG: hypothetical protein BWY09_03092 [Candidatus Hydrogenedentes bacterium ADurb.Bin179]|nr:MAG: hypothetical protein BWY09_03092 [Candidatus Hydrogenedentes bacterium ADurb.Bin179]